MSKGIAFAFVVLGMFALIAGGLLPGMHNAPTQDLTESAELFEGEGDELGQTSLLLNATNISEAQDEATVRVKDTETLEQEVKLLNASENKTFSVRGENVTVTLDRVQTPKQAVVTAEFPALYGYASGPRFVFENLGLLTVLFGGVMVVVLVGVSIQS